MPIAEVCSLAGRFAAKAPAAVDTAFEGLYWILRTCIHNRMMQAGQGIFPPCKAKNRSNTWCIARFFPGAKSRLRRLRLDAPAGAVTRQGGKRSGLTASDGCEYRFLLLLCFLADALNEFFAKADRERRLGPCCGGPGRLLLWSVLVLLEVPGAGGHELTTQHLHRLFFDAAYIAAGDPQPLCHLPLR